MPQYWLLKTEPSTCALAGLPAFRITRLSVVPVTLDEWEAILRLARRPE